MDYSSLKVVELKEEIKRRGIPTTKLSKKQDYIDRLVEDDQTKEQEHAQDGATATITEGVLEIPTQPEIEDGEPVRNTEMMDAEPTQEHTDSAQVATAPPPTTNGADDGMNSVPIDENVGPLPPIPETVAATPAPTTEEENKRKRRSATPDMSASTVAKKLKTDVDAPVHLAEDDTIDVNDGPARGATGDTDTVMEDGEGTATAPAEAPRPEASSINEDAHLDSMLSPPSHPVTTSIYISNLVRPIDPARLRSHLVDLATPSDSSPDPSSISNFHVDSLRTHAFATFITRSHAIRVRNNLHNAVYPSEPHRKPLDVDFVPTDSVPEYIETEMRTAGPRPSQSRKWEIVYKTSTEADGDTTCIATLVEVGSRHSTSQTGSRAPVPSSTTHDRQPSIDDASLDKEPPIILPPDLPDFPRTTTTPFLFHRPVSPTIVSARLAALASATNPSFSARADHKRNIRGTQSMTATGAAGGGLRRFTFEDGAELVDGGPETGGGRAFDRGPREKRGGYGGGGGGGYPRAGGRGGGDRYYPASGQGRRSGYGGGGSGYADRGPGRDSWSGGGGGGGRADRDWVRDRY